MKKEKIKIRNEDGALCCKYCKKHNKVVFPKIVEIDNEDLFYAQCPNCNHYDLYDFLGGSKKRAIITWNETMGDENKCIG